MIRLLFIFCRLYAKFFLNMKFLALEGEVYCFVRLISGNEMEFSRSGDSELSIFIF